MQADTAGATPGSRAVHLQARVRQGLEGLDLATDAGQQRALRVFVETALADEFGAEVLNDPGFGDMVESVQQAMTGEPAVYQKLMAMLKGMAAGGVPAAQA